MEAGALDQITAHFWIPIATLAIVFLGIHIAIRFLAPYADPVFLPAVTLINGMGVAFLRRIDLADAIRHKSTDYSAFSGLGFRQLLWTALSVGFAIIVLAIVRDHKSLSRYAFTLGFAGIVLVMIPAVLPARLSMVNGAKLWINFGFFSIQPGEFAKIALLVFFAYYLVRKREVLSLASRRVLGVDFPRGRDLGPVIAVWLMSLLVLIFEKDLGTSLMYFGMFIVTLYIATERVSWLIIGLMLFSGGVFTAYVLGGTIGGPFANFRLRADIWLDPFSDPDNRGYQLVQSLLGLGTGGLFGAGPGEGYPRKIPEVQNDFISAGLGEEIGLFGLTALLIVYLVIVVRGLRAALGVHDSFGKLFAGGLAFTLGLQVFVIVGGVSKLIPLTGQTTPFLSAGGSSLMANWILITLLIRISDAARRPAEGQPAKGGNGPAAGGPAKLQEMPTEVMR
ncbi:MAG: FtsW/RodA/SpoVE family cell cycle protein [Dactylosporangium sp.]|nr:FtsW/RodA/SpoVE family cell cycle protein [Dactylosporangium sp.]NNJ61566.1 FtsW/RodA/SpoVE family cell cycle protein [Dactylosporangium sp.]